MSRRDAVLAVGGGLAVAVILAGLVVVEANTGPFHHEVGPAPLEASVSGTFLVESDDSATCQAGSCEPPRTEVTLRLPGLPRFPGEASYVASLATPEHRTELETLEPGAGGDHVLAYEGEVDGDAFETLHVTAQAPGASPGEGVAVAAVELPTSDGQAVPLEADLPPLAPEASGEVELAQIGAVEVAITARGTVAGLPEAPGWTAAAWLVDDEAGATSLDAMEDVGDGEARVDHREARVTLAEQESFLVTLEPSGDVDGGPTLPVASAPVDARTLASVLG